MKTPVVLVIAGLLPLCAANASPIERMSYQLVTSWGLTNPRTEVAWDFDSMPEPAPTAEPDDHLVSFNFPPSGSAAVDREGRGACRWALEKARQHGDVSHLRLLIVGFADCRTESDAADRLSVRRAQATRDYLVSLGFPRANIETAGFADRYCSAGPDEPIRQGYDRRVSIWLAGNQREPQEASVR